MDRTVLGLASLLLSLLSCAPSGVPPEPLLVLAAPGAALHLDQEIRVGFDAALDPASVTLRSVGLADGDGRAVSREVRVLGTEMVVRIVIDASLFREPPSRLRLRLQGAPSIHALTGVDGRVLDRSREFIVDVAPGFGPPSAGAPRLLAVNGQVVPGPSTVSHRGALELRFAGRLDPASIVPEACPLVPLDRDERLSPVFPRVSWTLVGPRMDLRLELPPGVGDVELATRRLELVDDRGRAPEPRVVLRVVGLSGG